MSRRTRQATIREMALSDRDKLIAQIVKTTKRAELRQLIAWSLEINDAAQEFRIGEREGLPQFIRRLGGVLRMRCAGEGHAFEAEDPRCLVCGEANPSYQAVQPQAPGVN